MSILQRTCNDTNITYFSESVQIFCDLFYTLHVNSATHNGGISNGTKVKYKILYFTLTGISKI